PIHLIALVRIANPLDEKVEPIASVFRHHGDDVDDPPLADLPDQTSCQVLGPTDRRLVSKGDHPEPLIDGSRAHVGRSSAARTASTADAAHASQVNRLARPRAASRLVAGPRPSIQASTAAAQAGTSVGGRRGASGPAIARTGGSLEATHGQSR